jgi:uncharacterized repeat protein (TIGR01451 family)
VDGYAEGSWSCSNGDGGPFGAGTVTLDPGATVTCAITNDDEAPGLIIEKTVVNDNGGDATVDDFGISTSATGTLNFTPDGGTSTIVYTSQTITVDANTEYSLSEVAVDGYAEGSWSCSNGDGGPFGAGTVTLDPGATVTCAITNDDEAAELTVAKNVVNDDGGTATVTDFGISTSAGTLVWDGGDGGDPTTIYRAATLTVDANTEYSLSELDLPGYAESPWWCSVDGGEWTNSGPFDAGSITLDSGGSALCAVINDDEAASLILRKTVQGGTATQADFVPTIDEVPSAGDPVALTWDVVVPMLPGDYVLDENMLVSDYVAGEWGGDCAVDGTFSIALGEAFECTITNYYADIEITKSADPSFYAEVGDVITYTITATNTGFATLSSVDITDEFPGGLDDFECVPAEPATLAPGDSIVCTASHAITQDDIDAGSVFNQACVDTDETSEQVCDDTTV